jgi:hypothetical protein
MPTLRPSVRTLQPTGRASPAGGTSRPPRRQRREPGCAFAAAMLGANMSAATAAVDGQLSRLARARRSGTGEGAAKPGEVCDIDSRTSFRPSVRPHQVAMLSAPRTFGGRPAPASRATAIASAPAATGHDPDIIQ